MTRKELYAKIKEDSTFATYVKDIFPHANYTNLSTETLENAWGDYKRFMDGTREKEEDGCCTTCASFNFETNEKLREELMDKFEKLNGVVSRLIGVLIKKRIILNSEFNYILDI